MICKVIRRGGRGGGPTIEGEKEGDEEDRRRGGGRMCVDYDPSARTYATSPSLSLSSIHMSDPPLLSPRDMKREQIFCGGETKGHSCSPSLLSCCGGSLSPTPG